MKRSVLSLLILIAGVLVFGFSGCAKEEEEDLTKWPIVKPKVEKEVTETEEVVEEAITKSEPVTYVVKNDMVCHLCD
jgi:hypothetical protein